MASRGRTTVGKAFLLQVSILFLLDVRLQKYKSSYGESRVKLFSIYMLQMLSR